MSARKVVGRKVCSERRPLSHRANKLSSPAVIEFGETSAIGVETAAVLEELIEAMGPRARPVARQNANAAGFASRHTPLVIEDQDAVENVEENGSKFTLGGVDSLSVFQPSASVKNACADLC